MKRLLSVLLTLFLIVSTIPLAYAEDDQDVDGIAWEQSAPGTNEEPSEDQASPDTTEEDHVKVSTYDELQAAVSAAEDGDTIEITKQISIAGSSVLETEKHITLRRADDFTSSSYLYYAMFDIWAGGTLSGFDIIDTAEYKQTIDISGSSNVLNCHFDGKNVHSGNFINVKAKTAGFDVGTIYNCSFTNNASYSLNLGYNAAAICELCVFAKNNLAAIYNCGNLELTDCTITENWSGGIVAYGGLTTINNCQIYGNILADPEHGAGTDIYINGTLIITDEAKDEAGFYDETTGNKVELPYNNNGAIRLIYLSTQDAAEYFATKFEPEEPDHEEQEPQPEEPDTEPEEPDNGHEQETPNEDDNEELEPPQEEENNNTENVDPPQEPHTSPSEDSNNDDDDFTPPRHHKPTTKPTVPTETVPEEPSKPAAPLSCGMAVIDCSRSAKLQGYGDGQLHEDAPLSRAQMAVIVYRLLDDERMVVLSAPSSSFTDVDADAWYAPSMLALADAGVVGGTGNGYFAPDSPTTWAQLLTVLGRFVEQQECALQHIRYDGWARPAIETAVALGWIEDNAEIVPDDVITRGEAVDLINMVLKQYR